MKNEHIRPSIKEVGEERELAGVEKDRDEEIQSRNTQGDYIKKAVLQAAGLDRERLSKEKWTIWKEMKMCDQ